METVDFEIMKEIVGEEKAKVIFSRFGGRAIYFSKMMSRQEKYDKMYIDFENNVSYAGLSEKYGYSESHVRNVLKRMIKARRQTSQLSLF